MPGANGCAVWVTGDDVQDIYSKGKTSRLLSVGGGNNLAGCADGAAVGGIAGVMVDSEPGVMACYLLFPTVVGPELCLDGVMIVGAIIGALAGCAAGSGCFPGDALVQLHGGISLPMELLVVGHKVAVWKCENAIAYQEVYAFGHKSGEAKGVFVRISLEPYDLTTRELNSSDSSAAMKELELTALHFVPTAGSLQGKSSVIHKRAQDIQIGDIVWAVDTSTTGDEIARYMVKDVSVTFKNGLYNPLPMGGTILVNEVVASVHREWFLDTIFDEFGISSMLPAAYQLVLSPVRLLYRILGKQLYAALYKRLDDLVNVAEFGTYHGGKALGFVSMAVMFSLLGRPWRMLGTFMVLEVRRSLCTKE